MCIQKRLYISDPDELGLLRMKSFGERTIMRTLPVRVQKILPKNATRCSDLVVEILHREC